MRILAFTLAAFLATTAGTAVAQTQKAAAQSLYDDGRRLMTDGKYAEACAKFEASQRLDSGSGTELNLALCLEKVGKNASAWVWYQQAGATAHTAGEIAREEAAKKAAAALEPTLSKLRISAAPTPGLEVKLDGVAFEAGSLDTDLANDPGDHTIEATAPGRQPYKTTITLGGNADKKSVMIPALTVAPEGTPAAGNDGAAANTGWSTQRTAGVVIAGVGLVGVVVGSVLGANALSKNSASQTHCIGSDPSQCDSQAGSLTSDAKKAATISTIAFVAGGVGIAGGAVLFLTGGHRAAESKTAAARIDLHPVVSPSSGGFSLRATW